MDRACEITGYKKGYIYELVHHNKIPYIKKGHSLRFNTEELEK
ncbi:MAG: helix-turn-helix domain-containing protein [Rikenellaceae bacterium]|nr:helix-turn-helix domain-containing protein [Rikenellaceae bacterium]